MKQYFKKYKLNQIQQIKQTYKYIYIFRYNDITINENIFLKKKLKELKYHSLILKQNLINQKFLNIEGQGSLLIIYGNNNINLFENLIHLKKIQLVYLLIDNIIFSNSKLKTFLTTQQLSLHIGIVRPFLNFLHYLRKI